MLGQVVYSKNGRDKGKAMIVFSVLEEYVYLVDGERRLLEKPKKKKRMHIQVTNTVIEAVKEKLENKAYILDAEIRDVLKPFNNRYACKKEA